MVKATRQVLAANHTDGLALVLLDPTEAYEYFIITAVPAGITILFTPIWNDNVPQVVLIGEPALASTKLAVSCAMLIAQAMNLAIRCYDESSYSLQTMFAAVLSFFASLSVVWFLQFSKRYAFPSITFHNIFLTTTLLYDLAMMRHTEKSLGSIGFSQLVTVTLKLFYVLLNLSFKNPILVLQPTLLEGRATDAPSLPSIWSCLSWPGLVSVPGNLENCDLKNLPEPAWKLCSEAIFRQFKVQWNSVDKNSEQALAKAITCTLGRMLLSTAPLRLVHAVFTLAQPLLFFQILTTVFQDDAKSVSTVVNIAAAAMIWIGKSILKVMFTKQSDCIIVSIRAILIAAIYDKMMRVSAMDIQSSTALSQLMDGMRSIEILIVSTQDVASAVFQVLLGICFLWSFIGNASLLIFVPITLVALGSFLSGKQESHRRNLVTERRKSRVALTSSILKQLQSIKMMGLGPALAMYLNRQRKSEVDALLSVSTAFNVAVDCLSCGQQGKQILDRIQEFLLLDELVDKRLITDAAEDGSEVSSLMGATPTVELVRVTVMSKTGEVILLDATLRAFQYGMTMIFGPVACGKSAVLRLILGEITPSSGRLTVSSGPMVYCAQDVWLPFVCIQNGIVGDAVFDEEWYALVIRACGLEHEFEQLPDDDMTVIDGPRGRLSVSMKQRISLARAVYNRPTTIVLDDPLNAVQYNMASQIYENLFGDRGLVFNWECTVIMATNDFGHLQFADALFTVGYDGRMKSQIATTYRSAANVRAMLHDSNGLFNFPPTLEEAPESPLHPPPEEPDERDKTATHGQDASLSSYFQQPAGKKTIRTWYISVAATAIMEKMLEIFWSLSLSDSVLSPAYVAGYAAFGVASVLCNRMAAHLYFTRISTKSSIELHWRLAKTVMVATPEFVSNANIVSLLKLFDEDLETISRRLPITLMQRSFTLWALVCRIRSQYLPFAQRLYLLETQALMGVTVRCSETAAGIEHIRAFKQQSAFYQDFHGALTLSQKSYYYVLEAKRQLEYTIAIFTTAVGLATISLAFIYPQSSSPARLGLALFSIVELPEKLNSIATIWSKLDESLGAVLRIRRFCCETPIEVDEEEEPLPSKWPSKGAFEFFRVATENDGVNIDEASTRVPLVDASLEGTQKIVVSSRTGGRQPSLILAALRMINYSGAIRLDDMNIKNIPRVVLRSSMTTITREGLELEGTLRCNLDPLSMLEPYFSDADLISMLHRVKLWDAVQRRGGLDTSMKRMRFSKAQKQLLSLARGALHRRREDTKVVLIDDAITHLDGHTSKNVYDFIDGEFATCTVLMVAYDLEAIRTADTVITVEGGAITGVLERADSE
ncbi:ABC transporter [Beauveria bassiana ARSEF 2860]|uniref:ABC transporter n=1 Tax=Beauveria bassiana (strain ARSEF 2860) TaxID=655819 RepID=J5JS93_BEAB2|nr:ABC transporter [Beauveria bassiana ARSEF 2860]EJP67793.1 ABC transporter [Beauveria bassiana ARSEF 2860]